MASQKQARAAGRAKTADTRGQNGRARSGSNGRAQSGGQGPGGSRGRNGSAGQSGSATATQARPGAAAAGSLTASKAAARLAPPLWFQITTLVLSLAGLGMSIYLTIAHYTSTAILVCSSKGYIDCAKVTTSPESVVFGIFPVAVLGLAFYVFMVAITTPWAWRSPLALIAWARTAGIITGIGFVLYLVYAEVVEIGNICLLCTSVHIITFVLFVLLMSVAPFGSKAKAGSAR